MEKDLFWRNLFDAMDRFREKIFFHTSLINQELFIDLTVSQQRLLRRLYLMTEEQSEGVSLKTLADELGLSSSAVSVMVDVLVRRGVLNRESSPADRRQILIRFSAEAWKSIRGTEKFCDEKLSGFFDNLSPEEAERTRQIIQHFIVELDKISSSEQ